MFHLCKLFNVLNFANCNFIQRATICFVLPNTTGGRWGLAARGVGVYNCYGGVLLCMYIVLVGVCCLPGKYVIFVTKKHNICYGKGSICYV